LLRSLNRTYKITVVIVTHDINIMNKVDRVVTIRDGRASLESVRKAPTFKRPDSTEQPFEEFVLLDQVGRLQLPKEYVDKLRLKNRIRVTLNDDNLVILPENREQKEGK
jgi:energy-coupling factor transporter ATP-binding protein EcfA2